MAINQTCNRGFASTSTGIFDAGIIQPGVTNDSPRQYLSAWMSCGSIFMLLLAWFLGLDAVRLQRWAMASQENPPNMESPIFVVLGLAAVAIFMSLIIWMFMDGQYMPAEMRGREYAALVLFHPEVLAPGFLMASVVVGTLALVRFWFAGVALGVGGRGHGEGMRSPWMALGGGLVALINIAGSATTLAVVFWPKLLHL